MNQELEVENDDYVSSTSDHIFYMSAKIEHHVVESVNGCGHEAKYQGYSSDFLSDSEAVLVIREMVRKSGGQDLAQYCEDQNVKQIDLLVQNPNLIEFYVRFETEPTVAELKGFHHDFVGQLSDGWGEGFEQMDTGITYSETRPCEDPEFDGDEDNVDLGLEFRIDYQSLTQPVPYNSEVMMSISEVEKIIERNTQVLPRNIRP